MLLRRQHIKRLLKGLLPQFTALLDLEGRLLVQMWEVKVDRGGCRPTADDSPSLLHHPLEAFYSSAMISKRWRF